MIIDIIDIFFLLALSFTCFLTVYNLMLRRNTDRDEYKKILDRRIIELSRQQDILLETSSSGDSAFTKSRNKRSLKNNRGVVASIFDKISVIMKKASITDISVSHFMVACTIGGVAFAVLLVHFKFLNLIAGLPTGFYVGAYLIYTILATQAEQRKEKFLAQFPDAIDMMIRGVKAGLNINCIMKLVSVESKDPISTEYRTITHKFDLGIEPEKVLTEAADRIDIEEFRFLVVALVLQMENGGVLGEILHNLASMIRKRLELGLKLKAMSAEARMSAIVISALPFLFGGMMLLLSPDHFHEFKQPGAGQTLFRLTIVLFCVGAFLMFKATKIKV